MSKILQKYLRFWAKRYLNRAKPQIIAVTGSVGKTSTKEAIFEVLKIKFGENIRKSAGNLNNETGVPLAILNYQKAPSYSSSFLGWIPIILTVPFKSLFLSKIPWLVLEMAADKPGDIQYLTSFVTPNITVITSIGPAHLSAFGSIEKIFEEKTSLLRALPADGWAVLNIDEENLLKASFGGRWQTMTYGINQKADLIAKNITTEIVDFRPLTKFQVLNPQGKFRAEIQTLGRSWNVYSALAAIACANVVEMSIEEIMVGLKNIHPYEHRLNILRGKKQTVLIDDSYNANPLSMKIALDVLKYLPTKGRKIAVLGEMREIGKIAPQAHREMGAYAQKIADEVVSVGSATNKYQTKVNFKDIGRVARYLLGKMRPGDIILIKASRAIGLEKIVKVLKA